MPVIGATDVRALELALGKQASRQPEIHGDVWKSLERRGLVAWLEDERGESWFELTDAGCEELRAAGGTANETGACYNCGKRYAYPTADGWYASTCPVCGYDAADE